MSISMTCVTFDCTDVDRVADFWSDALGWDRSGDRVVPPDHGVFLEFIAVPEPKSVKNRTHLGLSTTDLDGEIERLVALGATVAWEEEFPEAWPFRNVVLRDVEGNEFCLGTETH